MGFFSSVSDYVWCWLIAVTVLVKIGEKFVFASDIHFETVEIVFTVGTTVLLWQKCRSYEMMKLLVVWTQKMNLEGVSSNAHMNK